MLQARTQVHQTYVFVLIQFQHHSILTQKHEEKKIFNFNFLIVKNSRKRRRNTKNINNGWMRLAVLNNNNYTKKTKLRLYKLSNGNIKQVNSIYLFIFSSFVMYSVLFLYNKTKILFFLIFNEYFKFFVFWCFIHIDKMHVYARESVLSSMYNRCIKKYSQVIVTELSYYFELIWIL